MNAKIMEGLVGADSNINLINTPMRVFKEARRKGDTAIMERAMGYAGEFSDKAEEYKKIANEGIKEDAEKAREKAELEREEAIRKRKEEQKELEERIAESKGEDTNTDTVEISGEGKALVKDSIRLDSMGSDERKADTVKEPVTYTKTGEVVHMEQNADISVSV